MNTKKFTKTMKLAELEGIICSKDRVSIREAGSHCKREDYMVIFSEAIEKYGNYYVWFIDADSENCFNIIVSENEVI